MDSVTYMYLHNHWRGSHGNQVLPEENQNLIPTAFLVLVSAFCEKMCSAITMINFFVFMSDHWFHTQFSTFWTDFCRKISPLGLVIRVRASQAESRMFKSRAGIFQILTRSKNPSLAFWHSNVFFSGKKSISPNFTQEKMFFEHKMPTGSLWIFFSTLDGFFQNFWFKKHF